MSGGSGKKLLASESRFAVNSGARLDARAAMACKPMETSADPVAKGPHHFFGGDGALAAVPGKLAAAANQRYSFSAWPVKRA